MEKNRQPKGLKTYLGRVCLWIVGILLLSSAFYLRSGTFLYLLGKFIVSDEKPVYADAIVVLNSGVEYYPRLIEAASLYQKGFARTIVINGNRKSDVLRHLEESI